MAIERHYGTTPFALKYRLQRELTLYRREEVNRIPRNRIGVYALWLPSEIEGVPDCLYVGKSEVCIRSRLQDHLRSNESNPVIRTEIYNNRDIAQFSVAYTANAQETDALETHVIQNWDPPANRYKKNRS